MISDLRTYIEGQSEELIQLQSLAEKSGMKVFVEVNQNFPNNFIDTLPFLAAVCKRFDISSGDLKSITEEFIKNNRQLLVKLNNFRHSSYPHEVTISFLLTVAIAKKYSENLDIASLQDFGWHEDAARIVLGVGG